MATVGEVFQRRVAEQVGRSSAELHVLAVDDSHVDRKVIERLLKISSCKVTAVESGTRALQYLGLDGEKTSAGFNDLKVNLIMTDYSMPGMTGYELLKKIKESSAFREIPVVVMSSENILTRIDRCLEEGAEEFIVKPVKLSDVERLRDCIMGETTEKSTSTSTTTSISSKRKEEEKTIKEEEDTMVKLPSLPTSPSTISRSSRKTPSPLISALQLTLPPTLSPKKPRLHNGA